MDKVSGTERKALPWALRRTHRDPEELVSVCACINVFVMKKEQSHVCTDAYLLYIHVCIYLWVNT